MTLSKGTLLSRPRLTDLNPESKILQLKPPIQSKNSQPQVDSPESPHEEEHSTENEKGEKSLMTPLLISAPRLTNNLTISKKPLEQAIVSASQLDCFNIVMKRKRKGIKSPDFSH
jgi:hypothetical protein